MSQLESPAPTAARAPHAPSPLDHNVLVETLRRHTEALRLGTAPHAVQFDRTRCPAEVIEAIEELLAAHALHERSRFLDESDDLLLAFEELARDQAAEVARQNEELRKQNAELTKLDAMKTEFLSTVSHELRTPLNSVIGFSELLLEGLEGELPAHHAQYIGDIHKAGRHLLGLINDILDLAKCDAGRMVFHDHLIDLQLPVREAEEIIRAQATLKQQVLEVRAEGQTFCRGDLQRIRQVVLNLIANAVKFTPAGGHISVEVRSVDGGAELSVTDDGPGIDPSEQAYVFEVFRQLDGSHTRAHPGTGLGLALVKKFSEAMGGTVTLQSAPGLGSRFTIWFPSTQPHPQRRSAAAK